MKSKEDVSEYVDKLRHFVLFKCKKCKGTDSGCGCQKRFDFSKAAYEACIPKDFWNIKPKDVTHNRAVFDRVIAKYVDKLDKALSKGYGLVLFGDNGVGKTYFISYVLTQAVRAGKSAYYTTLPQLEHDVLMGIDDKKARKRLDWLLTSDFLAIDEVGKEKRKTKNGAAFIDVQVERVLKQRHDDSMPILLATNMDYATLEKVYGPTIMSVLVGKCQSVVMEPGDFRKTMAKKMAKDMAY